MVEDRVFQALADPSRRAIFESLTRGEAAVKDLTARFDISQPAVSQHLATLKDAGLVNARREGRCVYYRVRAARDEAAHRLDRALPRLLDGAHRSPGRPAGEDGRMNPRRQDRPIADRFHFLRIRLASFAAEGVARAHRPCAAGGVAPARRSISSSSREPAFTFKTQPHPGWDGIVNCRLLEIEAHRKLSYSWVVGDMAIDTVVTFTLDADGVGHAPVPRAVGLQAGPKAELRRRALRMEDDGRKARRPTREGSMNWNKWIRQIHRWVSIAFTLTVIANFVALAAGKAEQPPGLLTYSPLLPLAFLLLTGLYLFVLPHAAKWRSGRRTD